MKKTYWILLVLVGVTLAPGLPATSAAQEAVKIIDRCCFDLDGGGQADDGIFVVSRGGTEILLAIIYEDPDKDKKFDDRDIVRAILVAPARRQ
jgi:hypothetical protein